MKKYTALLLSFLMICLLLCGCSRYPDQAEDGTVWNKEWEMLGTILGIEEPGNGLRLLENDSVLTGDDTFYASWVSGEASSYVNEQGKTIDLYPVQVYVLVYGCKDTEAATDALADFQKRTQDNYQVTETESVTVNNQSYEKYTYAIEKESNPYQRGATAFTLYKTYAVTIEVTLTESATEDPDMILQDFLNICHFAQEE